MIISKICLFIATLGPIGYMIASSTVATIASVPFMYWLRYIFSTNLSYVFFVFIFFILSLILINCALKQLRRLDDPSEIVLDEVLGCLVAFAAIPLSVQSIIVGIILIRFLSMLRYGNMRYQQTFINEWSILLDDVVIAVIVNIILRFTF